MASRVFATAVRTAARASIARPALARPMVAAAARVAAKPMVSFNSLCWNIFYLFIDLSGVFIRSLLKFVV